MKKYELIQKLGQKKLVAVVRGDNQEQVEKTIEAVIEGGINFIEVTFTIPNAAKIIADLAQKYRANKDIVIGAGTCLDVVTARVAILAGAQFVVSPHLDKEISLLCNSYAIPCFSGGSSVKDILDCLRYGADVVKLFPGELSGPKAIKAFKGPLPQAEFMPTGGVSLDNLNEWLDAGAFAVGLGGSLTKGAKTGDYDKVRETAKELVQKVADYESK